MDRAESSARRESSGRYRRRAEPRRVSRMADSPSRTAAVFQRRRGCDARGRVHSPQSRFSTTGTPLVTSPTARLTEGGLRRRRRGVGVIEHPAPVTRLGPLAGRLPPPGRPHGSRRRMSGAGRCSSSTSSRRLSSRQASNASNSSRAREQIGRGWPGDAWSSRARSWRRARVRVLRDRTRSARVDWGMRAS